METTEELFKTIATSLSKLEKVSKRLDMTLKEISNLLNNLMNNKNTHDYVAIERLRKEVEEITG